MTTVAGRFYHQLISGLTGPHFVRQLGNWRSSSVKSWWMGTLFSSHRKWLRTVMTKFFLGRERSVWILSAATWMCFTSEPGADRHNDKKDFVNSKLSESSQRIQTPRSQVVVGTAACQSVSHLSSCGVYQVELPGPSAGGQEEPEHTPDCCPVHSLSAHLACDQHKTTTKYKLLMFYESFILYKKRILSNV